MLRIGTDTGAEGVAFLSRPGAWAMLSFLAENVFRPELVGADPLQREWLWHRVWELDRIHEDAGRWNHIGLSRDEIIARMTAYFAG